MKKNESFSLIIGWLYPSLMSTYGDRGNIICLQKRCEWRNVACIVKKIEQGFTKEELASCDLLFMGGAQDRQQKIVSSDLKGDKVKSLKNMIENGTPGLYICGAYQFLGKYYKEADGTIIEGLHILDLFTENSGDTGRRLIGNAVVDVKNSLGAATNSPPRWNSRWNSFTPKEMISNYIVGFENHGGRTCLGSSIKPLGKVVVGFGNNGDLPAMHNSRQVQAGDKTEGAIYRNSIGSYLHGPILPKNPHLADWLLTKALEKKYKKTINLSPLDDTLEWRAHEEIVKRLGIRI